MQTTGWLRRVGPWVGIGTSPAALMMGGGLAQGVEGWRLPVTLAIGVTLLAGMACAQGLVGQREAKPFLAVAGDVLGRRASRTFASPVMLAMMLGWFALNVSVAGTAVGRLVGIPDQAGMLCFAMVALAVTWFGVNALSIAALAAGVATVGLAIEGIRRVLDDRSLTLLGDGHPAQPIGIIPGVALVIGFGAAFALRTPDFTGDLHRPRGVALCAVFGLGVPLTLFAGVGAILQQSTGTWNIADVLRSLGSPTVAYLFVAIGFAGSVMSNLYSGALSLSDATRIAHRPALVAVATAGTALASLHFSKWMLPYLSTMALAAPPLIALFWLTKNRSKTVPRDMDWRADRLFAWGIGVGTGLAAHAAGVGAALPIGLLATLVSYSVATSR